MAREMGDGMNNQKKLFINGIESEVKEPSISLSEITDMLLYGDEEQKQFATKWLKAHRQDDDED